jgi:hypothetical protein
VIDEAKAGGKFCTLKLDAAKGSKSTVSSAVKGRKSLIQVSYMDVRLTDGQSVTYT